MRPASCADAFAVADRAVVSCRPAGATERGTSIEAVACLALAGVAVTCDAVALSVGPLRIAIVDPASTARVQLRRLLSDLDGSPVSITVESDTAEDFLFQAPSLPLDAVFIDIAMLGGWEVVASDTWSGRRPEFVIVSAHREYALRAFDLEAADYLTKPVSEPRLLQTLLRLSRRRGSCSSCLAGGSRPLDTKVAARALSKRQRQILDLLDLGRSNKQIARTLGLSHFTVRNHISKMLPLFGVTRRGELMFAPRTVGLTPRATVLPQRPPDDSQDP